MELDLPEWNPPHPPAGLSLEVASASLSPLTVALCLTLCVSVVLLLALCCAGLLWLLGGAGLALCRWRGWAPPQWLADAQPAAEDLVEIVERVLALLGWGVLALPVLLAVVGVWLAGWLLRAVGWLMERLRLLEVLDA